MSKNANLTEKAVEKDIPTTESISNNPKMKESKKQMSEETRRKMSESKKKMSEETPDGAWVVVQVVHGSHLADDKFHANIKD